jgi:hypothetical protein
MERRGGERIMTQILSQMMWMPFSMFYSCMNAFAGAMRGMQQQPGGQGFDTSNRYGNAPGAGFPGAGTYGTYRNSQAYGNNQWAQGNGAANEVKEEGHMSSCNHCDRDETVKLVEYTIVSIKPCEERIIKKGQVIYADDMEDDGFAAWVIARYLQGDDDEGHEHRHEGRGEEHGEGDRERDKMRWLPRSEKRYLRVYHRVLESWRRPDDCNDNRQIEVLRDIERAIRGRAEAGA